MDGIGHARIAATVAVVGTAAAAYAGITPVTGGVVAGLWAGWLITPDADHHTLTHEERRWKPVPLLGPYLIDLWSGYGSTRRHRGRSHWIIWGTATRIVYFARRIAADVLLFAYVAALASGTDLHVILPALPSGPFLLAMFAAWAVQDAVHIITDVIWSGLR